MEWEYNGIYVRRLFWGVLEWLSETLEQCLAHSRHYRFAKYDVLLPLYTVFLHIYHPIFSIRSLFYPLPSPLQFINYIPDFIATQMSVGFSKSHCILFLIYFSLLLNEVIHFSVGPFPTIALFLDSKSLLFSLKGVCGGGRGIPQSDKVPMISVSTEPFRISLPSVQLSFPVVSVM